MTFTLVNHHNHFTAASLLILLSELSSLSLFTSCIFTFAVSLLILSVLFLSVLQSLSVPLLSSAGTICSLSVMFPNNRYRLKINVIVYRITIDYSYTNYQSY
jgi:hypothetical protein